MRAAARLWKRTPEKASSCASFCSSSNGSVKHSKRSTTDSWDSNSEARLLDSAFDNAGAQELRQPPPQSLHKAILAGEVTLTPFSKVRKNGKVVTIFSVATGGKWRLTMASKAVASEDECTDPCLQNHKVVIHDEAIGRQAAQTLRKGMTVYVEGELETRVFNDGETGMVKRQWEIAVRATGQVLPWKQMLGDKKPAI